MVSSPTRWDPLDMFIDHKRVILFELLLLNIFAFPSSLELETSFHFSHITKNIHIM